MPKTTKGVPGKSAKRDSNSRSDQKGGVKKSFSSSAPKRDKTKYNNKSSAEKKLAKNNKSDARSQQSKYQKPSNTTEKSSKDSEPKKTYKFSITEDPSKKRKREEDEENGEVDDEVDGDADDATGEKTEESELTRNQAARNKKLARKQYTIANADLIYEMKKVWEKARDNRSVDQQKANVEKLFQLVQGHVVTIATKHDTSRVIQTLFKLGTPEMRASLSKELKGNIAKMADSQFARFITKKALKYAPKEDRTPIIEEFYGKIPKLMKQKISSEVVDFIYEEMASPVQKWHMISEFYGAEFAVIKDNKKSKLSDLLKERPEKKQYIIASLLGYLEDILDKGVPIIRYTIVHQLLCDLYEHGDDKSILVVTAALAPFVPEILHTKPGSIAAMHCIAYSSAKHRKVTIKALATLVARASMEEYGHKVILAILRFTDDSKLVSQVIISEIIKSLEDLAIHPYGRLVVLFLLAPNSSLYFPEASREHLKLVSTKNETGESELTSKKDDEKRGEELFASFEEPIKKYCEKHAEGLIAEQYGSSIIMETALKTKDPQLLQRIVDEVIDKKDLLESKVSSRVIKRLVKELNPFAQLLANDLKGKGEIATSMKGAGFTVLSLLENPITKDQVFEELTEFSDAIKESELPACKHITKILSKQ